MNTNTTLLAQLAPPKLPANFKISPPLYLMGGLLAIIVLLTIFQSRFVKKGKTARAALLCL